MVVVMDDKLNIGGLLVIDGNAILHRAYHAIPALTNSTGEPVNAVYGFFSMLFNVIRDARPEFLAVCFDRPAPTFRQSLFVGYQQHRPALSDDFVSQIVLVHTLLSTMGVAVFELDGYEADDLIGTIAERAIKSSNLSFSDGARNSLHNKDKKNHPLSEDRLKDKYMDVGNTGSVFNSTEKDKADFQFASVHDISKKESAFNSKKIENSPTQIDVVILTGDRDLLQLVNGRVKILMPLVGISKTALMGEREVEEKYGVKPSQFVDYKALIGDASDGYPGVAGVGPKTAYKLISEWGSFENLYKNLDKLPEKIGVKLATDADQAALAFKLAKIVTDVPLQFDLEKCKVANFDIRALRRSFEGQGFKSLTARMIAVFEMVGVSEKKEEQMGLL